MHASTRLLCVHSLLALVLTCPAFASAGQARAVLVTSELPGHGQPLIDGLTALLKRENYTVETIALERLYEGDSLTSNPPDVLVVPNATVVPVRAAVTIERYLRTGGDFIALRTPLGSKAMARVNGQWTTRDEYFRTTAGTPPAHVLYDLSEGLKGWQRSSNHPEFTSSATLVKDQPVAGQHAVHIEISDLRGWDTHMTSVPPGCFPPGHTLTMLSAKGSGTTQNLAIEWEEKDGSRWIAVAPLGRQWQRMVLAPEQFKYWESVPSRSASAFNPANAVALKIGLAHSHTGVVNGKQEYWFGPIGTGPRQAELEDIIGQAALPILDTICPSYKLFECHEVALLTTQSGDLGQGPPLKFSVPQIIRSPHPRAGGAGFDKGRAWRWMALMEARSGEAADWRGTPATLLVHADGPYKGGAWLSVGVDDEGWYRTPEAATLLGHGLHRMCEGVFLVDGGTDKYTYLENQDVRIGATVVNIGKKPAQGYRCSAVLENGGLKRVEDRQEWRIDLGPGEKKQVTTTFRPAAWAKKGYICAVDIRRSASAEPTDALKHTLHVWRPRPDKHFITVQDGRFMLDGRRWRANGINYMPSSGIGTEDGDYFENWTGPRAYDPAVIDRDLGVVKNLGYNAVSVFTHHGHYKSQNIVDLIRRCDELGLKVNLFLRPSSPRDFQFEPIREMIENLRIAENDTVFAYDIDWEPLWGRHADRVRWDRDWEAWIVERYRSIANAEKDWAFAVPRDAAGKITNPLHAHIVKDGEWRRMVAAYRRFLDTLQYHKYATARELIRGVDPHHLVSFRMTEAGDPTCEWDDIIPYDFPYLASAVDFLAPEAYARIGDWEQVKPGWFQREYARWAAPAKPMIWAEQGMSTWYAGLETNSPDLLERQAAFYREFYRMMIASSADGIFSWWYPGGFRYGENSDFGIIHPDGSDRPVSKVIREMGPAFLNGPDLRPVDTWIEFDRDAHATGIVGAYRDVQAAFWQAIDAGRTPGLRTAGTGSDSQTCPAIAVGNTPADGSNPLKFLDAAFDMVEMQQDGAWITVTRGGTVHLPATLSPDAPASGARRLALRMRITNLGEAAWRCGRSASAAAASDTKGIVELRIECNAQVVRRTLTRDVAHRETLVVDDGAISISVSDAVPTRIELVLEATGRGRFGERFSFTISPVPTSQGSPRE